MITGDWSEGAKALALVVDGETVSEDAVSLTLTDDLNGDSAAIRLGATASAVLTLVIRRPRTTYADRVLTASVGGVPLGTFRVAKVETQNERAVITAVDAMGYAFEGDYVPAASTSTALTVIRAICAACGVTVGDVSDVTDVPVSGLTGGVSYRTALGYMAALLGRNAHIGRDGALILRWYKPVSLLPTGNHMEGEVLCVRGRMEGETLVVDGYVDDETLILAESWDPARITQDQYYSGQLTAGEADITLGRITCSVTRRTTTTVTGSDGRETTALTEETEMLTAGSGGVGVVIENPYMTQPILDRVWATLGGRTYRPLTVTFYGDARLEVGDILTVVDANGAAHSVPIMRIVHSWDGGVRTTATSIGPRDTEGAVAGTLSDRVTRLAAAVAEFENLSARNLSASNARFDKLYADWAAIDTAIINSLQAQGISADWINAGSILAQYIKLYGLMGIYPSSASGSVGGYLGYTGGVAESGIAQGIAQVSEDYHTVCIVGTGGAYIGFHGDDELWVDGGDIKILTSNYPTAIILRQPDDSSDPEAPVVPKYGYMVLKNDVRVHGTLRVSTDSGATYRQPMAEITSLQTDMTDAQSDIAEIKAYTSGVLASGNIRYAKRAGTVTVMINYPAAAAITPTAGAWNDLATLPAAVRPGRDIDFVGINNAASSGVTRAMRITSGGVIRYWADASGETATVRPAGTITYIIGA